jgi:NADH-quinone oxidoreductase subunit M
VNSSLSLFWIEAGVVVAAAGSLCVLRLRDPMRAWRLGLFFTAGTLVLALVGCLEFYGYWPSGGSESWGGPWVGEWFGVDELSAPLFPLVALLHFFTVFATGRTKVRRFSLSLSLAALALGLATFACQEAPVLIGLLVAGIVLQTLELRNRKKPARLFLLHMAAFIGLLVLGWSNVAPQAAGRTQSAWATVPVALAVLIRCGAAPAHCWITDWFEQASFGIGMLLVAPLFGLYAAVRLLVPIAPDWLLQGVGLISLITALYAAGMAAMQTGARRFFAYLLVSNTAMILVGLELHTDISLSGALALWISAALSLAGLGLTLRALEARYGELSLTRFHGLYEHSPMLAVCFLLTGLASVGFPGTFGFVASELLIDGAVEANLLVGLAVALATAMNGIAIVRAYFCLFTGTRHYSSVPLGMNVRERWAVLTLSLAILGGGLFPQPMVASRYRAATMVLRSRGISVERARELRTGSLQDGGNSGRINEIR